MATDIINQLRALAHRPQRKLLVALSHRNPRDDTPVDSEDLEFDDVALERLFDFQQFHLPDLEANDFIDYDRENHRVAKGSAFGEIEPLIQLINKHGDELPDDWL